MAAEYEQQRQQHERPGDPRRPPENAPTLAGPPADAHRMTSWFGLIIGKLHRAENARGASCALDPRTTNQPASVLGVSDRLVLGGEGLHRSGRRRAVRIDQLPVEATVTLADDLEMGAHANFI